MEIPKIDGFEILEKLGEGGMASVWKARQISLDRIVAIKILSPHLAAAAEDVNRFLKEACATAQLKHQGIVQVYDAKVSKELYCFVMEYVAGYTVGDWVRRKGNLSENDTLTVIDCIADAMDYALNATGVVHCDIKPDNIIIDADGTVKVADLGLAHTINAINVESESDEIMGTPAYISPEQAEGRDDLDCRSDIYSLGAMMYHMLTGKLMFQGESDEKVMQLQVRGEPVDAQKLNPDVSTSVNDLLKKMLKKKRSDRPQDWDQVRRMLLQVRREVTGKYEANGTVSVSAAVIGGLRPFEQRGSKYKSEKIKNLLMMRTLALFIGFLVVAIITRKACQHASKDISVLPTGVVIRQKVDEPDSISVDDSAREMFGFAKERQHNYPNQIDESIQAFRKVALQTKGTKYSLMAEDEIKQLQKKLKNQINMVMTQLDGEAKVFVDAGQLLAAAKVYELYNGVRQKETSKFRQNAADLLRVQYTKRNKDIQLSRQKNRKVIKDLIKRIPEVILTEGVASASDIVQNAVNDPALKDYKNKLSGISEMLTIAGNIDQYILESFREQIGQEIVVNTAQGRFTVVVITVDNYRIVGRQDINVGSGVASSEIIFSVGDLSPREKMSRMGSDNESVALVKGIMAYDSRAYGYAIKFFESLGGPLAEGLVAQVDIRVKAEIEQAACDNLRLLLSNVGVDVTSEFDVVVWKDALGDASIDAEDINKVTRLIELYMSEYGDTDFAKSAASVVNDLNWMVERRSKASARSSFMTEDESPVDKSININKPDLDLGWRKNSQKKQLMDD